MFMISAFDGDNEPLAGDSEEYVPAGSQGSSDSQRPSPPSPGAPGSDLYSYPKAPLGKRILAYIVDTLIASIVLLIALPLGVIPVLMGTVGNGDPGAASFGIMLLVVIVGGLWATVYSLIRDGLGQGQSFGKRLAGLMVVRLNDNRPCEMGNSALRNVIQLAIGLVASWIPVLNFVGGYVDPLVAVFHNQGWRLGDMLAKTQVIDVADYRQ